MADVVESAVAHIWSEVQRCQKEGRSIGLDWLETVLSPAISRRSEIGMTPGGIGTAFDTWFDGLDREMLDSLSRREVAYHAWREARARLSQAGAGGGVVDGWKIVPIEPDELQIEAMRDAFRQARRGGVCGMTIDAQWRRENAPELAAYSAALTAAPTPPAPVQTASVEAAAWMYGKAWGSGLSFTKPEPLYDDDGTLVEPVPLYAAPPAPGQTASGGEPVAWVIPGDDNARDDGSIDAMAWREGEFTRPLYATPPATSVQPTASVEAVPILMDREQLREKIATEPDIGDSGYSASEDVLIDGIEQIILTASGNEADRLSRCLETARAAIALAASARRRANLTPAQTQGDGDRDRYKEAVDRVNRATDAEIGGIDRRFSTPSPSPVSAPATDGEVVGALNAVVEGYPMEVRDDRYIVVDNPSYRPDNGSNPKLVIDVIALSNPAPGHTDLMVSPESIDAFLEANPPPDPSQGEAEPVADQLMEIRGRLVEQRQDAAAEAVGMAVACLLAAPSEKPAKQEDGDV